jgi:squalene cyclase
VVTLLAYIDLGARLAADPAEATPARDGRERAAAWLERQKPGESTQARALQLFRDVRAGKPAAELQPGIQRLLGLQREDGGWGQEKELASDAYATGQALYFLGLAGVPRDRAEIRRAVEFLTASQKVDGSWPMTSRAHPGAKPMTNPVPITYFGSAWGMLGLLRSLPTPNGS